jgi:hypothetical protein
MRPLLCPKKLVMMLTGTLRVGNLFVEVLGPSLGKLKASTSWEERYLHRLDEKKLDDVEIDRGLGDDFEGARHKRGFSTFIVPVLLKPDQVFECRSFIDTDPP